MVAPLLIGASVAGNVALDYGIQRMQGRGYTAKDAVTAGALGALPGIGLVKPGAKVVSNLRHLRHFDRSRDTIKGVAMGITWVSRPQLVGIKRSVIRTQLVKGSIDYVFDTRTSIYQSRGRGQSLTSELMTPRQPQTKRSAGKRTFSPRLSKGGNENGRARRRTSYCQIHRKYDFCNYYKIN